MIKFSTPYLAQSVHTPHYPIKCHFLFGTHSFCLLNDTINCKISHQLCISYSCKIRKPNKIIFEYAQFNYTCIKNLRTKMKKIRQTFNIQAVFLNFDSGTNPELFTQILPPSLSPSWRRSVELRTQPHLRSRS